MDDPTAAGARSGAAAACEALVRQHARGARWPPHQRRQALRTLIAASLEPQARRVSG